MTGKGFIKVVALLLLLLSVYNLFFTWQAGKVESKANAEAVQMANAIPNLGEEEMTKEVERYESAYLDSVYEEPVINLGPVKFNYKYVKKTALKLGLDLQGGMSVVMEADQRNLLKNLSKDSQNSFFLTALDDAKEAQKTTQTDFVDLVAQNFKGDDVDFINIFRNIDSEADITERYGDSPSKSDIVKYLKSESNDAFASTYDIIRTRMDKFGLLQPTIQRQDASKRIMIEIPGVTNPARVRKLLQSTANLEFFLTYDGQDITPVLIEMDRVVKDRLDLENPIEPVITPDSVEEVVAAEEQENVADTSGTALLEELLTEEEDPAETATDSQVERANPILSLLNRANTSAAIGSVAKSDTAKINAYLAMAEVQAVIPQQAQFRWDAIPFTGEIDGKDQKFFNLYALRGDLQGKPQLDGAVVRDASYQPDERNQPAVSMSMNEEGANAWEILTGENIGKPIAILLDDVVYSAPAPSEKIGGGVSSISGQFTITEAQDLATVLKTGKLEVPARIIEEAVVGPTLGKKSIRAGLLSLLTGLVLVLIFMVLYYGKAGIIADIALLFNLFLVIGILAAFGSTLTLPGIAGLVLTIGMAVDANVIIFERIREELSKGSALEKAVRDGFQASYSAIIDANVTTFIIALILFFFGIGPIKGFAVVLMIGIATSLFTGVLFTRVIKDDILKRGKHISYATNISKTWFQNLNFDFISKRKLAYIVSGTLVALSLGNLAINGGKAFDLGVDLSSGRSYVVDFGDNEVSTEEVNATLNDYFGSGVSTEVKTFGSDGQLKITTNLLTDQEGLEVDSQAENQLFSGLSQYLGDGVDFDQFRSTNLQSRQKVDPTIADDLRKQSSRIVLIALLCIFLYLFARFLKWQYGLAAVVTLAHDTLILLGAFSLFRHFMPFALEVDQAFIAALLTVIGYSINDTVVVFDRIREYLNLHPKKPHKEVINQAINSTLSRTLITSLTTLLVITLLFVFGGQVIKGFAFALLLGVLVGTYSSIFVATPIVVDLYDKGKKTISSSAKKVKKKAQV